MGGWFRREFGRGLCTFDIGLMLVSLAQPLRGLNRVKQVASLKLMFNRLERLAEIAGAGKHIQRRKCMHFPTLEENVGVSLDVHWL